MLAPYRVIRNAPYPLYRRDSGTTLNLSKDGGALAAATNTPAETPAASGIYYGLLTATEMTADIIAYKGAAGNDLSDGFLIPEPAFDSGVAQSGTTTNIRLRAGAPSNDLSGMMLEIVRGTGSGQRPRLISAYDTTNKDVTPRPDFGTAPDNTSVYIIRFPDPSDVMRIDGSTFPAAVLNDMYSAAVKAGTVASGSTTSVIKTSLTGYGTRNFVDCVLQLLGTANYGLMRRIIDYNSVTGDITVYPPFASAPAAADRCYVFGTVG